MRGLVTAGRVVRLEWASLSTKANVASRGWLFIGFAWIPFLARVPGFHLQARTLLLILFVGRLLETMVLWCAAGRGQVFWPARWWGCRRPWRLRGQGRP
jgi:hypothetical protein